eukprot:696600-Amphidinium_carterae.1
MPLSGSVPVILLTAIPNMLTARITWSPLPGSAPSKLFRLISNFVTARIVRMPLSGSLLTARITWSPLSSFWERSLEPVQVDLKHRDCAHPSDAALGKRSS